MKGFVRRLTVATGAGNDDGPGVLRNRFLSEENARQEGVLGRWAGDNDQWWDWYMSLAVNSEPSGPPEAAPALPALSIPTLDRVARELDRVETVPRAAIDFFRKEGWVRLDQIVSPGALLGLRQAFSQLFARMALPAMGFPSLDLMWTHDPWCRAFVLSPRLGAMAAQLLGVPAVRIYHDNALVKSPGCGRTPWHYDAHHYPIASENVVTVWIPLQATPEPMGPLVFAGGIETWRKVRQLDFDKFGTGYDEAVIETLRRERVPVEPVEYDLGSLTFHHTRSLHSAGPNRTDMERMALATTYFEDGARLVDSPTIISGDFEKFMPGIEPGQVIDTEMNPVVWNEAER